MTITRVYKSHLLNAFMKPRLNTCKVCTLVTLYTCTVLKKHVSITHYYTCNKNNVSCKHDVLSTGKCNTLFLTAIVKQAASYKKKNKK